MVVRPEATIVCDQELATVPPAAHTPRPWMFGFTAESAPDEVLVHGFRVTRPDQAERDAGLNAIVAEMVRRGPQLMRMTPDGALVPITESS